MDVLQYKTANCQNCYKCIRHCPVKAISFVNNRVHVLEEECIRCGNCVKICPQNVLSVRNDMMKVIAMIREGKKVIAAVDSSYVAAFKTTGFESVRKALMEVGFADAVETSAGACLVKRQYEDILQNTCPDVLIASHCDMVNRLIQTRYPELLPYLAPVLTPMQATAKAVKISHPEAIVVSVSPCLAKKEEYHGNVEETLIFTDVLEYMEKYAIRLEEQPNDTACAGSMFAVSGGVVSLMNPTGEYQYLCVGGFEECRNVLDDVKAGKLHHVFLELNGCVGGCIQGPCMPENRQSRAESWLKLKKNNGLCEVADNVDVFCEYEDKKIPVSLPTALELETILESMGKYSLKDERNCGGCGYNTCREKAVAVFQGKADRETCVPFVLTKTETVSKQVLKTSPNAVIALDRTFHITSFNRSAYELLEVDPKTNVIGQPVEQYLDADQFMSVLSEGSIMDVVSYLPKQHKYVEKRVVYDGEMILIIMKDVTEQQEKEELRKSLKRNTIEITDQIINKQMRIVQEIASLLGETTAETKIALKRLRDVVVDRDED